MKKAIFIGLMAVAAVFALRPVVRRTGHKMRQHCEQMMGQFGDRAAAGGEEAKGHEMPERCEQMMARAGDRAEPVGTI